MEDVKFTFVKARKNPGLLRRELLQAQNSAQVFRINVDYDEKSMLIL